MRLGVTAAPNQINGETRPDPGQTLRGEGGGAGERGQADTARGGRGRWGVRAGGHSCLQGMEESQYSK